MGRLFALDVTSLRENDLWRKTPLTILSIWTEILTSKLSLMVSTRTTVRNILFMYKWLKDKSWAIQQFLFSNHGNLETISFFFKQECHQQLACFWTMNTASSFWLWLVNRFETNNIKIVNLNQNKPSFGSTDSDFGYLNPPWSFLTTLIWGLATLSLIRYIYSLRSELYEAKHWL